MTKNLKFILFIFSTIIFANSCRKETEYILPAVKENTVAVSSEEIASLVENFESGIKTNYSTADVTLSEGSWNFNNAMIVTSSNYEKNGTKLAQVQNSGMLTMNFDVNTGASAVLIDYAKPNTTTTNTTFELWSSTDGGINWVKNSEAISVSSTAYNNVAFYMDYHEKVRFQIRKIGGGDLALDNFKIENNLATATQDNNMALGNPSKAITNVNTPNNYLLVKPQYTLAYNSSKGNPIWVSWHLSAAWKGNAPRIDCFRGDETLPAGLYRTTAGNYNNIGFDRGHQCPSDDRDKNTADNRATFYMTDMLPQAPNLNRITWLALETYCRTLAAAGNELYIISGGYGTGGKGSNGGVTTTVANGKVEVPAHCWKVVVVLSVGTNDVNRVTSSTRVIAVDMPNVQTVSNLTWGNYRVSVDAIETATGLDLLSSVKAATQNTVEARVDNGPTN